MDPRKLLYFAAVIEHGSFKKAARQLLVSQPALSTSMDRLEASLGVKLLDRGAHGTVPTAIGEILYSHARLIRDEMDRAEQRLRSRDDQEIATIKFGVLPSLTSSVVPLALEKWRKGQTSISVKIDEKIQIDLLTSLLRHEIDFFIGMTEYYGMIDGIKQRVLFRDKLCVLSRANHPIFQLEQITWPDLVKFPWICPMVGRQRSALENILQAVGASTPDHITECSSFAMVTSLVAKSDHFALVPAHAVYTDLADNRLRQLPIQVPEMNRNIAVFFRDGFVLNEAIQNFISCVESVGTELAHEL